VVKTFGYKAERRGASEKKIWSCLAALYGPVLKDESSRVRSDGSLHSTTQFPVRRLTFQPQPGMTRSLAYARGILSR
jgi:hypothetical protein